MVGFDLLPAGCLYERDDLLLGEDVAVREDFLVQGSLVLDDPRHEASDIPQISEQVRGISIAIDRVGW